jgi:hypothetical protein
MTCITCKLQLNVNTRRYGYRECSTCRRNQSARERRKDRKQSFPEAKVGRIVGDVLARFYVPHEQQETV